VSWDLFPKFRPEPLIHINAAQVRAGIADPGRGRVQNQITTTGSTEWSGFMQVVIQCASSKVKDAGFLKTRTGQRVKFVAHPTDAPRSDGLLYFHPDDNSDLPNQTWRQQLVEYNKSQRDNHLRLLEAYRLYEHSVYRVLVDALSSSNVFILSAGWGLVRANYLLPDYDITFKRVQRYKHRLPADQYDDFCHLSGSDVGPLVYFGGKDYLCLFHKLTRSLRCEKIVFFATDKPPGLGEWKTIRYPRFTNWHYQCAREFLAGRLSISSARGTLDHDRM
jgi:hypothetical protein